VKEVLREVTMKAIEELGDHVLGCVIIGGYPRGRSGNIDVVIVVDTKETIRRANELQEKMKEEYDLHPMTLEAFGTKILSD